jgi:hypothetical protein
MEAHVDCQLTVKRLSLQPMAMKVMTTLCLLALTCSASAAPSAGVEPWAKRLRALTPQGWTLTMKGDSIVIARDKPIQWQAHEINGPGRSQDEPQPKPRLTPGVYRLTLKFGPKMSMKEYDRLAAENAATAKERDRLEGTVRNIDHKFDQYLPKDDAEKKRFAEYRAAVAKLTNHDLPEMYCDDFSIHLLTSDDGWSYVYGEDDREECEGVRQSLLRFFGMYDPSAARDASAGTPKKISRVR